MISFHDLSLVLKPYYWLNLVSIIKTRFSFHLVIIIIVLVVEVAIIIVLVVEVVIIIVITACLVIVVSFLTIIFARLTIITAIATQSVMLPDLNPIGYLFICSAYSSPQN